MEYKHVQINLFSNPIFNSQFLIEDKRDLKKSSYVIKKYKFNIDSELDLHRLSIKTYARSLKDARRN